MAAPTDIDDAITDALVQPSEVTDSEGRKIKNRSIKELQDARDRETGTTAKAKPAFGLRFTKLIPPGAG